MSELSDATAELVHSLCCAIIAGKDLNHVINVLQVASNTILDFNIGVEVDSDITDGDLIKNNILRLAEITNVSAKQIRAAFFSSSFQELAEVLLSVVGPDWLNQFPDDSTKSQLFYRWFHESSAPALLRCLSWHLSSVEPLSSSTSSSFRRSSLVLPLSANIAADLLTHLFMNDQNSQQLESNSAVANILEAGLKNQAAAEESAGLLASIPDRVVLLPQESCPKLQTDTFIPFLVEKLIQCVKKGGTKYTILAAEVLARVVQRGHTRYVATTIAQIVLVSSKSTLQPNGCVISSILAEFPASSALERLVEALVRELPLALAKQNHQPTPTLISTTEEDYLEKNLSVCLDTLKQLLPVELWQQHSEIRLLFQDKLLTQKVLPSSSLSLLLSYLDYLSIRTTKTITSNDNKNNVDASGDIVAAATWRVASLWGEKSSIHRLPTPQQAYMTFILQQSLKLLGKSRFEGYSGLLPALLRGISARLDSPREPVRRQAMRVGREMSQILDGNAPPLFGDENIDLMAEEQWEDVVGLVGGGDNTGSLSKKKVKESHKSRKKITMKTAVRVAKTPSTTKTTTDDADGDYPMTETDSDDEYLSDSSGTTTSSTDSEFEKYDVDESDDDDVEKTHLQLRDIISLIQKSESDWKGHLRALRSAEALIRAAPDELTHYSVPLARALLLTSAPAWADEELPRGEDPIEDQRFRSLVALTAADPDSVGLSLAAEVYSPSLDVQQRSRALAALAAAAQEVSSPGSILKAIDGKGSDTNDTSSSMQRYVQGDKVPGKSGRVVRASERSLLLQAAERGNKTVSRMQANRFPPVALKWAAALLKECDVRRHGVDLFGRDYFILGRLLATLGTFLESSQQSLEAAPLATAVIELIKGQNVHDNEEPYVRRAALMAASHACMAVPPGALATALLPATFSTPPGSTTVAKALASTALVERLEWLRVWTEDVAETDPDNSCRMMAAACRGLQGALSAEAMASMAASVSEQQQGLGSGTNVILPSFSIGGVSAMPSANISSVPRIETLNLK